MICLELFWTFFKIGAFTFGGGYAMLPLIQAEVEAHGWMESADLINFVAVSESTPGPFAVNISTYVGTEMAGSPAAFQPLWVSYSPLSSLSCSWPGVLKNLKRAVWSAGAWPD